MLIQVNKMCQLLDAAVDRSAATGGKLIQQRPVPIAETGLTGFDLTPTDNTAVFEVPAIIQDILDSHPTVHERRSPGARLSP